jgi:hypothetical protein
MLALGCAEPPTAVPLEQAGSIEPSMPTFAAVCSEGSFAGFSATSGWNCNSTVEFYTNNGLLAPHVANAIAEWQTELAATGFSDLPAFTTTGSPSLAEATVNGTHSGTAFCGHWNNTTRVLQVFSGTDCDNFDNSGPLPALLLHEVGHAVGWTSATVDKVIFATAAADHCVMNLPTDGSLNGAICAHEIEGALAAYGLVSHDVNTFFSKPFVVGSATGLAPFTLQVGQTASPTPGEWRLDRGGTVPGTASSYTWSTTDSAVATVTGTGGIVTAVAPGTAMIRAVPTSSGSYLFAHPFRNAGVSGTVTVPEPPPPPPPPPPLYAVTTDETPLVTPGSHGFTAHIGSSSSTIHWRVDDSRTTTVDPDTTFSTSGQLAQLWVDAGSYTLVFRVGLSPWPSGWNQWYLPPGWYEQQIPVCTGDDPQDLAGSGKTGGGQTDAVENCPPEQE